LFQVSLLTLLLLLSAFGFWQFSKAIVGLSFLVYLLTGIAALVLVPWLVYRLYSLYRAKYTVERDGIHLQWGLRVVDIPMDRIEWIHPVRELEGKLPLPPIRLPGAVIGTRKLEDGSVVEYMASTIDGLVLISLGDRYFAVSPAEPGKFLDAYEKFTELGSLSPLDSKSVYPSFLLARFWNEKAARYLFLVGILLCMVLLGWVILIIPTRAQVPLRLDPLGMGLEPVPSVRLLLLPVLSGLMFAVDFLGGLFFFRNPEGRTTAFIFWAAGVLTPLLFLFAVGFIQRAS
jgi:hypothetical protein